MPRDYEALVITDEQVLGKIRDCYVASSPHPEFFETDAGRADADFNTFVRYNRTVRHILPWLEKVFDVTDARILEIGCGTGSSTAAFARIARQVDACDVDSLPLQTARQRVALLGLRNAAFHECNGADFLRRMRAEQGGGFDIVLLSAVLEHQTFDERLETLREGYDSLRDGGVLVVLEAPNRLTYIDMHTSWLPFFDQLPPEVAVRYFDRSVRPEFVQSMKSVWQETPDQAAVRLTRWGRGVSFHDFDLALEGRPYTILADGYDGLIVSLFGEPYEERLLQSYFAHRNLQVHPGFARDVLFFVMRKGAGSHTPSTRQFEPLMCSRSELDATVALAEQRLRAVESQTKLIDDYAGWVADLQNRLGHAEALAAERLAAINDQSRLIDERTAWIADLQERLRQTESQQMETQMAELTERTEKRLLELRQRLGAVAGRMENAEDDLRRFEPMLRRLSAAYEGLKKLTKPFRRSAPDAGAVASNSERKPA